LEDLSDVTILTMLISSKLEFDAGHRIPSHNSHCRHLHGHRYAIEITLSGNIITDEGIANQGMIMDYSEVKRIAKDTLINKWDHAFLVYSGDIQVLKFLQSIKDHKTVILDKPPTAENLALIAFDILDHAYIDNYENNLRLEKIRLYETPNCWADAIRKEN